MMNSESDFLEIIILGAIAAFLIYRLVSTLGQNSGFQQPLSKENLGDSLKKPSSPSSLTPEKEGTKKPEKQTEPVPTHLQEGVSLLIKNMPDFSLKSFLNGATDAYEMIVKAFAEGNLEALESLMDPKIFTDFKSSIEDRQNKKLTLETTIVRVSDVAAQSIEKDGTQATITVAFVTEQTHVLKDEAGDIIEGSPQQIEEVTDVWTFTKSLRSQNPNWSLVATGE